MLVVLSPAPLISEAITNGKRIFNVIAWEFSFDISNTSSLEKKNFVKSEWKFRKKVKKWFFPWKCIFSRVLAHCVLLESSIAWQCWRKCSKRFSTNSLNLEQLPKINQLATDLNRVSWVVSMTSSLGSSRSDAKIHMWNYFGFSNVKKTFFSCNQTRNSTNIIT